MSTSAVGLVMGAAVCHYMANFAALSSSRHVVVHLPVMFVLCQETVAMNGNGVLCVKKRNQSSELLLGCCCNFILSSVNVEIIRDSNNYKKFNMSLVFFQENEIRILKSANCHLCPVTLFDNEIFVCCLLNVNLT